MKSSFPPPSQIDMPTPRSVGASAGGTLREWRTRPTVLHELVRAQAQKSPDAIAAVYENQWLTYRELIARSDRWAAHLRRLGVDVGTPVGIHLERSLELPVIVLAILKAGGVCVPLEPTHPAPTLTTLIQEARLSLILTESSLRSQLPTTDIPAVAVDREVFARGPAPESPIAGCHLAFVLFTSGSTGTPKGVMISHATIAARMFRPESEIPPPGTCMTIMKTAISHSPFLGEMFTPLLHGCYFVIARPGGHQDIPYLGKLIINHGVTYLATTSTILRSFLDWPGAAQCRSLKGVYCGGEAVTDELMQRFFKCLGQAHFLVSYGTSEGGHKLTCECGPNERLDGSRIGRPIANAQVHLLDARLEPVPQGEIGEMYLAGPRLATGYLNQPRATAERFLPNPLSSLPGDRFFRSGDFARLRPDGEFEFKGRDDQQVKILGNRVELAEIEAAIASCPGISAAVVTARTNDRGDSQLVAYIVTEPKPGFLVGRLRERLAEHLPSYMVPHIFVPLDSLPQTVNGKVDRLALPAPEAASAARGSSAVVNDTPRHDAETLVVSVFERFLEIEHVGIYDDFFALGGHSLLAVEVVMEINRLANTTLGIGDLIRNPTAEALATSLTLAPEKQSAILIPLCESSGQDKLFCIMGIQLYQPLAKALRNKLSVYSVLVPIESLAIEELAGGTSDVPFPAVEELARQYAAIIREEQPSGPYHLIGLSFGGIVAFEIARQFEAQGEQTSFVGLLDCAVPSGYRRSKKHWLIRRFRDVISLPAVLWRYRRVGTNSKTNTRHQRWRARADEAQLLKKIEWSNRRFQYGGSVTLFRAVEDEHRDGFVHVPDFGWKNHVQGRIDILDVPGNHLSMLTLPNVECLANLIVKAVATADDRVAGGLSS